MVRNNKGGKNGKKVARKHIYGNNYNAKIRVAEEEGEIYACVTKLLGNGMCHVNCLEPDDTSQIRLCIIRNKFRGRGKRDNQLNPGSYVLVGLRTWETNKGDSMQKCDLIEVYSNSEVSRLKSQVDRKWGVIHVAAIHDIKVDDSLDDIFSNTNTDLVEEIEEKMNHTTESNDVLLDDYDVDIDDI